MARFQPSAPAKSERVKVAGAVHENSGSTIVRKVLYVTGRPARATMSHVEDGDQHSGLRGTFNRRKGLVIYHRGRIRAHVEYHNRCCVNSVKVEKGILAPARALLDLGLQSTLEKSAGPPGGVALQAKA
jgi:hypothetical protein